MLRARFAGVAVVALTFASSAGAAPTLRYSWDACSSTAIDRMFTGPGVYTQVISIQGLTPDAYGVISTYSIRVGLGPSIADAWSFDYGGCQGFQRLSSSTQGGGCAPYPASLNVDLQFGPNDSSWHLVVRGNLRVADPHPDPAVRYTLAVIGFDHRRSVTGPTIPGVACGGAERPQCFALEEVRLLDHGISPIPVSVENGFLRWQDPNNATNCPPATPSRAATWGRIKALYR